MKNTRLYLNVPYKEKDEAKVLGARWDPERKEWYTSNTNNYHFFRKWYYNPSADAVLYDYIYILMANRTCFRCKKQTQVIALASNDTTLIYENNIKHYNNDIQLFRCIGYLSEILSSFLKDKFNFYYSYSKFTKSYYYGNH